MVAAPPSSSSVTSSLSLLQSLTSQLTSFSNSLVHAHLSPSTAPHTTSEISSIVAPIFSTLKLNNRVIGEAGMKLKDVVGKKQEKVEDVFRELKNLEFEKWSLERQIRICEETE
jgi:hypothetical protein